MLFTFRSIVAGIIVLCINSAPGGEAELSSPLSIKMEATGWTGAASILLSATGSSPLSLKPSAGMGDVLPLIEREYAVDGETTLLFGWRIGTDPYFIKNSAILVTRKEGSLIETGSLTMEVPKTKENFRPIRGAALIFKKKGVPAVGVQISNPDDLTQWKFFMNGHQISMAGVNVTHEENLVNPSGSDFEYFSPPNNKAPSDKVTIIWFPIKSGVIGLPDSLVAQDSNK